MHRKCHLCHKIEEGLVDSQGENNKGNNKKQINKYKDTIGYKPTDKQTKI